MNTNIRNAVIKSASLTTEDRGLLTAWLQLEYDCGGQGFGGHALYLPKSFDHHKVESFAGHFIYRCMEIAGVTEWSKLPGKTIRVRGTMNGVEAIGHIINNDWFAPATDFSRAI